MKPPITAAEVSAKWIADAREALMRGTYFLRAGENNAIMIGAKHDFKWRVLTLPSDATAFMTAVDRDAVLKKLSAP